MLIIGIMISLFTMSAFAESTRAEIYRLGHDSIKDGRERTPTRLPIIDIVYDPNSKNVEIISSIDCDANVFIYDLSGNLIASSDSLDKILSIVDSNSSAFFVRIESSNWYATATINI